MGRTPSALCGCLPHVPFCTSCSSTQAGVTRSWVACMHPDLPNPIEWHHLISATDETRSCVRIFSHHIIWCDSGFPWQLSGAESVCSTGDIGDVGSIPGSEDPLEEEMATLSSILAGKSHRQRSLVGYSLYGLQIVGHS